jgi:hypothetical protein
LTAANVVLVVEVDVVVDDVVVDEVVVVVA